MQRARELLRSIQVCDEEGRRQDLHRIVRRLCPFEVDEHARFRPMLPDVQKNDALHFFGNVAKEASDHLRQVTSNKAWKALWLRRCADMLASFRVNWDSNKV